MPAIGLVVEGEYDKAALPILLQRCRRDVTVVTRTCRGTVSGRLSGILHELDRYPALRKVLIVSDADGKEPTRIIRVIQKQAGQGYRFGVVPLVIVEMLEAWLIADPIALERVAGVRGSFKSPERIRDPKSRLHRLLRPRKAYTPEIARRLARELDLATLVKACPRFATFRAALR